MNKVGSNCKVTENKRFYNALLLGKFKQFESSQLNKLYPDTYSLQILSLNSSYAIIACIVSTLWIMIAHWR